MENLMKTLIHVIGKVKVDLSLCHEDVWWSGGIAPPFAASSSDRGYWSASCPI
jgi:hypothetical protein